MCVMRRRGRLGEDEARSWADDGGDAPRVLIESADGAEAHAAWRLLQRQGYGTMWCPGPRSAPMATCVLSQTGHCPLVEQADVVVSALDVRDPACARVVRELDAVAAGKPVVVVAPLDRVAGWREELGLVHVVPGPLSARAVLSAVR